MATKFPNTQIRFRDTYGAGGITVHGIELQTDEDGFVEGPSTLETHIAAHGFIKEEVWFNALPSAKKVEIGAADLDHYTKWMNTKEVAEAKQRNDRGRGGREERK